MSTFLITGCAGFIGSHLLDRLLSEGHRVYGIDNFDPFYPKETKQRNILGALANTGFVFHEADIRDPASFNVFPEDIDFVLHLAAKAGVRPSIENPESYLNTNILGTLNVLEFMRKINCKNLVFASSSSIYGNNIKIPFEETDNVDHQISPYAVSKKSGELLNYNYHNLYNFNIINLRFFTVYGPRQRPDLAIHKFVSKIMSNEKIDVYGDGGTSRDYTFVDDTISGIVGAIKYIQENKNIYETINLGNNHPVPLKTLIEKIETSLNCKAIIQYKPMQEGDVDITYASIEKAKTLLNYSPKTSIDEGLKKFISWYKEEYKNKTIKTIS
jgi:UDP-glucuronate 4-epimerase